MSHCWPLPHPAQPSVRPGQKRETIFYRQTPPRPRWPDTLVVIILIKVGRQVNVNTARHSLNELSELSGLWTSVGRLCPRWRGKWFRWLQSWVACRGSEGVSWYIREVSREVIGLSRTHRHRAHIIVHNINFGIPVNNIIISIAYLSIIDQMFTK